MKYDYSCPNCGITVEIDRSINSDSDFAPTCDCGSSMNRDWTFRGGIIFKGGGWGGK
jgi:predicted nucleic acid-binding Zn ribbon protein